MFRFLSRNSHVYSKNQTVQPIQRINHIKFDLKQKKIETSSINKNVSSNFQPIFNREFSASKFLKVEEKNVKPDKPIEPNPYDVLGSTPKDHKLAKDPEEKSEKSKKKSKFAENALIKAYNDSLETHPFLNKVITFCILMAAGDIVAQYSDGEQKEFDWGRFGRMVGLAAVFSAPILHVYFKVLDKVVVGTGSSTVFKKLFIDQLLFAPINLAGFMSLLALLEKGNLEAIKEKISKDYWPTLKANWILWPAANFVNFKFVPSSYRLLYVSVVAFFWNIYFSILANKK